MGSCDSGWWDVDGLTSTGCECGDGSDVAGSCNTAVVVGTIGPANTSIVRNGVIVHRTGYREDEDCYSVTYNDPAPVSGKLTISVNAGLVFDLWRGNCGSQECDEQTVFETLCDPPDVGIRCDSDYSTTFYVCVHASTNGCHSYTLNFAYGPAP
jgi:hypothetical protein